MKSSLRQPTIQRTDYVFRFIRKKETKSMKNVDYTTTTTAKYSI